MNSSGLLQTSIFVLEGVASLRVTARTRRAGIPEGCSNGNSSDVKLDGFCVVLCETQDIDVARTELGSGVPSRWTYPDSSRCWSRAKHASVGIQSRSRSINDLSNPGVSFGAQEDAGLFGVPSLSTTRLSSSQSVRYYAIAGPGTCCMHTAIICTRPPWQLLRRRCYAKHPPLLGVCCLLRWCCHPPHSGTLGGI